MPPLREWQPLKGCRLTLAALGGPGAVAEQSVAQGGDSLLGRNGNHRSLQQAVEEVVALAQQATFAPLRDDSAEAVDKDHARLEVSRYGSSAELRTRPETNRWVGLRSIGMVERTARVGQSHPMEQRDFISCLGADPHRCAQGVHGHGRSEPRWPWRLEVVFGDDANRSRKGNAPTIMTFSRHRCMNLFDPQPSSLSRANHRRQAAWNDDFRAQVVFG